MIVISLNRQINSYSFLKENIREKPKKFTFFKINNHKVNFVVRFVLKINLDGVDIIQIYSVQTLLSIHMY
jgi:hypothetical protein